VSDRIVIIPTYNEIENIEAMVHKVMGLEPAFHLLVVDDNSPDSTADKVELLQKEYGDRLYLLKRKGKAGLGTAYIAGFKWCLERHYQYICEMDCDFSHNPDDLNRLVSDCVEGADMAVGAGFVCYSRKVLEQIGLDRIKFKGYAFQIEMKFRTWKKGFKIQEVPIIFTDRTLGVSKMSTKIFREALFGVMELRIKSIFGQL